MDPTIQPTNQQLYYPHLAIFDTPNVEREVVEQTRRTDELVEIVIGESATPRFDHRSAEVQVQKVVVRENDAVAGVSYGSVTRDHMLSNLDIWI